MVGWMESVQLCEVSIRASRQLHVRDEKSRRRREERSDESKVNMRFRYNSEAAVAIDFDGS